MKLSSTISALALACVALADDQSTCAVNHPSVANAIGKFCQNQSIMVPSDYAKNGMTGLTKYAFVGIKGKCSPAQWVPQEYCFSQFWNMCANRGAMNTEQTRKYGRNDCQIWYTYAGEVDANI